MELSTSRNVLWDTPRDAARGEYLLAM